jgi:hypothetical protein
MLNCTWISNSRVKLGILTQQHQTDVITAIGVTPNGQNEY